MIIKRLKRQAHQVPKSIRPVGSLMLLALLVEMPWVMR
jgi:hypothetical protein